MEKMVKAHHKRAGLMFGNYNSNYKPRDISPGFTLIELVIVIMLIALLGAIVVPNLRSRNPGYERKKLFDTLEGIVNVAQLEAVKKNTVHRVFFDLKSRQIRLEAASKETTSGGAPVYKPASTPSIKSNILMPENLEIKNFFIKGRDELGAARGHSTDTLWFYITPEGVAQEVIINMLDTNDLGANNNPAQASAVLNPFTLQFTLYDEFQQP